MTRTGRQRVRELPAQKKRVETGAIRFGDDWPGLFVRGDDCMGLVASLSALDSWLKTLPKELLATIPYETTRIFQLKQMIDKSVMIGVDP